MSYNSQRLYADIKGLSNDELLTIISGRSPTTTGGVSIEGTLNQSVETPSVRNQQFRPNMSNEADSWMSKYIGL
jgi:hypothetical protein